MTTTVISSETDRLNDAVLVGRFVFATALLALALAIQWPGGSPPPDFQVWVAADVVAEAGGNPYDTEALNAELRSDAEAYGEVWQDQSGRFTVKFFNPPTWLALLKIVGFSPLTMSVVGIAALSASLTWISREADNITFAGYICVPALLLLAPFSTSTRLFGQSGLLLAGLVGIRLALSRTSAEGIPLALLSFKPHIAFAAALPALMSRPKLTLQRLVPAAVVVVVFTSVLYGFGLFSWFVTSVVGGADGLEVIDDMTLRTFSPRLPLPSGLNMVTLAVALGIIAVLAQRKPQLDLGTLTLFSLALTIFFSGHGFEHDWLWVAIIPAAHRWNLLTSAAATMGFVVLHSLTFATSFSQPWPLVSTPSLAAIVVVGYLGWQLVRQAQSAPGVEVRSGS